MIEANSSSTWDWPWWMYILWAYTLFIIGLGTWVSIFPVKSELPKQRLEAPVEEKADPAVVFALVPSLAFLIIVGIQNFKQIRFLY